MLHRGRIVLIGDTLVHEWPEAEDLADIATRGAAVARSLGLEPRVAFLSFSNFGYPVSERAIKMHEAPQVLDRRGVDFEYEGEMTVDVALNPRGGGALSVQPPDRAGKRAGGSGAAFGLDLGQADAGDGGGDGDRADPDRGRRSRSRSARSNSTVSDILNMAAIAAGSIGAVR